MIEEQEGNGEVPTFFESNGELPERTPRPTSAGPLATRGALSDAGNRFSRNKTLFMLDCHWAAKRAYDQRTDFNSH
jgi:hypothetical protein